MQQQFRHAAGADPLGEAAQPVQAHRRQATDLQALQRDGRVEQHVRRDALRGRARMPEGGLGVEHGDRFDPWRSVNHVGAHLRDELAFLPGGKDPCL